ncbi:hypothetical protein RhiLY_01891 [Ceratobasidium sp. AG-Ba]|nr:hypothetical protein RhiLY_01891 [Ceratobasidium sp. AG-Ba]
MSSQSGVPMTLKYASRRSSALTTESSMLAVVLVELDETESGEKADAVVEPIDTETESNDCTPRGDSGALGMEPGDTLARGMTIDLVTESAPVGGEIDCDLGG